MVWLLVWCSGYLGSILDAQFRGFGVSSKVVGSGSRLAVDPRIQRRTRVPWDSSSFWWCLFYLFSSLSWRSCRRALLFEVWFWNVAEGTFPLSTLISMLSVTPSYGESFGCVGRFLPKDLCVFQMQTWSWCGRQMLVDVCFMFCYFVSCQLWFPLRYSQPYGALVGFCCWGFSLLGQFGFLFCRCRAAW